MKIGKKATTVAAGCDYQGYEFGASYPDSICVKGRLFDADNCDTKGRFFEPADYFPCPKCNREAAVRWAILGMHEAVAYSVRRKRARLIMRARVQRFLEGERKLSGQTAGREG